MDSATPLPATLRSRLKASRRMTAFFAFYAFFAVNCFQQTPASLRLAPPLEKGAFLLRGFAPSREVFPGWRFAALTSDLCVPFAMTPPFFALYVFFAVHLFQQTPARLRRAPPLERGLFFFAASRLRVRSFPDGASLIRATRFRGFRAFRG